MLKSKYVNACNPSFIFMPYFPLQCGLLGSAFRARKSKAARMIKVRDGLMLQNFTKTNPGYLQPDLYSLLDF